MYSVYWGLLFLHASDIMGDIGQRCCGIFRDLRSLPLLLQAGTVFCRSSARVWGESQKKLDFLLRCGIINAVVYPGVAQLVGRHIWDVEAARSSRATRTKHPLKSRISVDVCYFLSHLRILYFSSQDAAN